MFLLLEDGTVYPGTAVSPGIAAGPLLVEAGVNTYLSLTNDPANAGKLLCLSYPAVGNFGVSFHGCAAETPQIAGLIVHSLCEEPSNWESEGGFGTYLREHNVPVITGIDVRAVTRRARQAGRPLRAAIADSVEQAKQLLGGADQCR